jgi:hypothetical protein
MLTALSRAPFNKIITGLDVKSGLYRSEWLPMMSDALLAQSAVDRLTSGAHTLIIEGPSYRQRHHHTQRPTIDDQNGARNAR